MKKQVVEGASVRCWGPAFGKGLLVAVLVGVLWVVPGWASDRFEPEPVQAFTGAAAAPWDRVERLVDPHPAFGTDRFPPGARQRDERIVGWFGSATPPASQVLLHCAPGWQGKTLPRPVLLVHGAGDDANRAWVFPFRPPRRADELPPPSERGFATWLSSMGYAVFAVTFAHNQGCNIRQAEQIANAIRRIRRLLGRENDPTFQVDLIAHSKGNAAARLYCSDARAVFPNRPWLSHFRGDVRTYVNIAGPLQGIDIPFRYYGYNLARVLQPEVEANSPMGADRMVVYGLWRSFAAEAFTGRGNELWPGQAQVLFNLVRDGGIPLGVDSYTAADANLSMMALYHGGTSCYLHSPGIDAAIERGERFMYRLEAQGLDPRVRLAILAGDEPQIDSDSWDLAKKVQFFYTGLFQKAFSQPSDGVVFTAAMTDTRGILRRGATLVGRTVVPCNHLDLARNKNLIKIIDAWLLTDR